jgi:hypothetical protein
VEGLVGGVERREISFRNVRFLVIMGNWIEGRNLADTQDTKIRGDRVN